MMNKKILTKAKKFLKQYINQPLDTGIILGSGLDTVSDAVRGKVIPYKNIPGMVSAGVKGHSGKLVIGKLGNKNVAMFCGRIHYYEGYSWEQVTCPVRLMNALGIKNLVLTAAVGAVNPSFMPGDIVLLKDHINLMGDNPLRGMNTDKNRTLFVDLTETYDSKLRNSVKQNIEKSGLKIREGVYLAVSGPSYETPAEVAAFRKLGADVVGMSVVPESITAKYFGMRVIGIVYVANFAAGVSKAILSHNDVLATGHKTSKNMLTVIKEVVRCVNDNG